jgi:hypothetical protein
VSSRSPSYGYGGALLGAGASYGPIGALDSYGPTGPGDSYGPTGPGDSYGLIGSIERRLVGRPAREVSPASRPIDPVVSPRSRGGCGESCGTGPGSLRGAGGRASSAPGGLRWASRSE